MRTTYRSASADCPAFACSSCDAITLDDAAAETDNEAISVRRMRAVRDELFERHGLAAPSLGLAHAIPRRIAS